MIDEIVKFVETIPEEYHTKDIKPSQGIHIFIDLDNLDIENNKGYKSIFINKKNEVFTLDSEGNLIETEDYPNDIGEREYYSSWISPNKSFDPSNKKMRSTVAYILGFKVENIEKIEKSFDIYFKKVFENSLPEHKTKIEQIKKFCESDLINLVKKDKEKLSKVLKLSEKELLKIFFINFDLDIIKKDFYNYLKNNLFNTDEYNQKTQEGKVLGLSGFFNTATDKKQFLVHHTAFCKINSRISENVALYLYKFEQLLKNEKLPNPLPIFIDKDELNESVVRFYNDEGVLHFREIIKKIFDQHSRDLFDYYLINWRMTKDGLVLFDFDFVSKFRYSLSNYNLKNILGIKDVIEQKIENIFQFELEIVGTIFDNSLVMITKNNGINLRYFEDIDFNSKYMSLTTYQNILKYRKSFYDYIYKSREQAITGKMFYDLIISTVIDDVKKDEKHNKTKKIKEKLNILFSLNDKFDKDNKNFKGVDMASKIPEYQECIKKLFNDCNYHIADDNEFAFASGQLIYYILYQSQKTDKTHALLEPFISKNSPELFKKAITRCIEQYKHELNFGHRKLNKLVSEVLGYDCKTVIKDILPVVLAGYFSNSLIFEKNIDSKIN